ncbi:MAG: MerR family transcriptional regulator [Alphaproteobacteria bacterium]|nr:MAG: MerR family transcriptional regulator [Alphaproteobacteria bacterium]
MAKSPDAFRTISEVSEWLDTPPHVLRFWESRFPQVKPVKRAGGRRYYRPADMRLLGGIKKLLHDDGLTIRGVQKILREKGVHYVMDLSPAVEAPAAEELHGDEMPVLSRRQRRRARRRALAEASDVVDAEVIDKAEGPGESQPTASSAESPPETADRAHTAETADAAAEAAESGQAEPAPETSTDAPPSDAAAAEAPAPVARGPEAPEEAADVAPMAEDVEEVPPDNVVPLGRAAEGQHAVEEPQDLFSRLALDEGAPVTEPPAPAEVATREPAAVEGATSPTAAERPAARRRVPTPEEERIVALYTRLRALRDRMAEADTLRRRRS